MTRSTNTQKQRQGSSKRQRQRPAKRAQTARLLATLQATVLENPYIPHDPTPKQAIFLMSEQQEILFGGAAGPGKSDALLMAALQYVTVPGYAALLLRRTMPMLKQPGSLIPRSKEWLTETDAIWHEQDKTWTFPAGATIKFGHVQYENDVYDYQSGEYQFIGFDELTQFTEFGYTYLSSRLRRLEGSALPLRKRSASNPGGVGHEWVRARFIAGEAGDRLFIPARLDDNPWIDREEYVKSLDHLDPVTREQLLNGDWDVRPDAAMMRREWFPIVDVAPADAERVRYWDLAATEVSKKNKEPDWTASTRMSKTPDGRYFIEDVQRLRAEPFGVEKRVRQTAELDGYDVPITMEQEPGASGKAVIDHYHRIVLPDFAFRGDKKTGSKTVRAAPFASQAEAGNIAVVRGPWNEDFLREIEAFPYGSNDDQVDSTTGAYDGLSQRQTYAYAVG